MNKYLKRQDDGTVDWSTEGFELLNDFQRIMGEGLDLTCRRHLSVVLESRGFHKAIDLEEYVLSDGAGKAVWVYLNDEALTVVRNRVMYNFPMHYELGSDELCDLWEMIRKAWNAEC
tara:strand:+ start:197 stop:547 length:351 start_codon:yes stop_codon:yes gene_type:complete